MRRVRVGLLAAVIALSGCYRWSAPLSPTAPKVMGMRGGDLHVTPQHGQVFRLVNARIAGDTLRGDVLEEHLISGDVNYTRSVAMPIADVHSIAFREFSIGRTGVLVGSFTVATWLVVRAAKRGVGCVFLCGLRAGVSLGGF
jgi:hypothetical protein